MNTSPTLSVILATYNRRQTLARALSAAFTQDLPATEYEVIVADDGSSDGTVEYLHSLKPSCGFRVIVQTHGGKVAARNAALAAARGHLVLLLDDDILCDRSTLRMHVTAHSKQRGLVVHGPVLASTESPDTLATEWVRLVVAEETKRWQAGSRWPEDANFDPNYSVPRSALLECGGWDEAFTHAKENTDLGLRLWGMGLKIRYEPRAVAHHVYIKTANDLVRKQAYWWGRNEIHLCRKHKGLRPHSPLAILSEGPRWKTCLLRFAASTAKLLDLMLGAAFRIAEMLRHLETARRLGVWLLAKRLTISFFRGALLEAGSWQALRSDFGVRLPVLLYHHVGPRRPGTRPWLTVSAQQFERDICWLSRRGYRGIRLCDWLQWCRHGTRLPANPVLLTFDDGYADVADYALPVLRHHGFGALVFVVTGHVGGTNAWDEARGSGTHRLMDAEQLRYWASEGIDFGAHSRTHADLTAVREKSLLEEVAGSGEDLARILACQPASFAYPYGVYDRAALDSARGAFATAFTTDEGLNSLRTDSHVLRRTMVLPGDSLLDLKLRLRWGWNPIQHLRARVRLRTRLKNVTRWFVRGKN